MTRPLTIRGDIPANQLRQLAARNRDAGQARRLLAIAAALAADVSRAEAAAAGGMDRQTLRDWIIRYNASGPEGLVVISLAWRLFPPLPPSPWRCLQ